MSVLCIPVGGVYLGMCAVVSVRSYKRVCVCSETVNGLEEEGNAQLLSLACDDRFDDSSNETRRFCDRVSARGNGNFIYHT